MKAYYNESGKLTQINISSIEWAWNEESRKYEVKSLTASMLHEEGTMVIDASEVYASPAGYEQGKTIDIESPCVNELFFLVSDVPYARLAKMCDNSIIIDQNGTIKPWEWKKHHYDYDPDMGRLTCEDLQGCRLFSCIESAKLCHDYTLIDEDGEREVKSIYSRLTFSKEQDLAISRLHEALAACKEAGLVFGWNNDCCEMSVMRREIDCIFHGVITEDDIDISALMQNGDIHRPVLSDDRWESEDNLFTIKK